MVKPFKEHSLQLVVTTSLGAGLISTKKKKKKTQELEMSFSGSNMHEDNLCADTSELQSDSCVDLSQEFFRIATFASFPNGCPISMSTLARAGFYYTGEKHKVSCFSCGAVVEEWTFGESPVAKHRQISPHCKFISGGHNADNALQFYDPCQLFPNLYQTRALDSKRLPLQQLGVSSPHQDIDPNYLLRTKQIVDMSDRPLYPRNPAMCNEEVRIMSFRNWPDYSPITPGELANAGLFYKGIEDQVECFCCGGKLKNWEPGDRAWTEHKRHFPNCFFVLKHDVGNIPCDPNCGRLGTSLQSEENLHNGIEGPKYAGMASIEERIRTFMHWNYPIDVEKLARAGFYSTGIEDNAMCFYCGGALRNWEANDDPWEQHAKWYPGCNYLVQEKGCEFVNSIHLRSHTICETQDPPQKQVEHAGPLSEDATQPAVEQGVATVQSAVIRHARDMGFELEKIMDVVEQKLQKTGKNYDTVQALVTDLLKAEGGKSDDENTEHLKEADVKEKLRRLQEEKLCKICMDKNVSVVFIPCGHLVACQSCAEAIEKCPICCCVISQRYKTFMS